MPRLRNICLALSLLTCAACSRSNEVASAPPPPSAYQGIPAGLLERCVVKDVALTSTGDIVTSRGVYKEGFGKCAAKIDAIRDHDAQARAAAQQD